MSSCELLTAVSLATLRFPFSLPSSWGVLVLERALYEIVTFLFKASILPGFSILRYIPNLIFFLKVVKFLLYYYNKRYLVLIFYSKFFISNI